MLFDGAAVNEGVVTVQRAVLDNADSPAGETVAVGSDGLVTLKLAHAGVYHAQLRQRFIVPGAAGKAESHTYALTLDVGE